MKKLPVPYAFPKPKHFPEMPVSAENPVTVEGAALGRYLFYDPLLSADSTIACASCHKQENAFADAQQFSKGIHNSFTKRNAMPLFNLAWYPAFFADGRALTLEEQVLHPVRDQSEMNGSWEKIIERLRRNRFYVAQFKAAFGQQTIDSNLVAKAIAQFERTLISCSSKYDRVIRKEDKFTQDELEGFEIVNDMTRGNCVNCHTTDGDALGTIREFSNIGLDSVTGLSGFKDPGLGGITKKPADYGKFKIPSLRNVASTAPYMHDGRFKTLDEVIEFYSKGIKKGLNTDSRMDFAHASGAKFTDDEKRKIIAFIRTLTDSAFIKDAKFSNPFRSKTAKNN